MHISERLRAAQLWPGSLLALADSGRYLTRAMLVNKRDGLRQCDDRTGREDELLHLLDAELAP